MGFIILILAAACYRRISRSAGLFSWLAAGFLAFFVYSIPAIIGLKRSFYYTGTIYLEPASNYAVMSMIVAWASFYITLQFLHLEKSRSIYLINSYSHNYDSIILSSLLLSLFGIIYLIIEGGSTFFLISREDQVENYLTLTWRWFIVIGFTAALVGKRPYAALAFLLLVAIIFVQGDRTIPAISLAIYFLIAIGSKIQKSSLTDFLFMPKYIAAFIISIIIILFGKPIYLSIKEGSFYYLTSTIQSWDLEVLALSAEPFVTFDHIEAVNDLNIQISFVDFFVSVFGNLLIIPSAFGVSTNLYNELVTANLPPGVSYGVAGNYWAHAIAVGGYAAVAIFAALFAAALALFDRTHINQRGKVRIWIIVLASTTAIYLQRNAMDNFFSFVRQIILCWLAIYAISPLIGSTFLPKRSSLVNARHP